MEKIKVRNLTKTFELSKKQAKLENTKIRKKVAVKNLSFTVNKGEIYGLLGPNGAGKTTVLRCIVGLINPTKGDIFLNNMSVKNDKRKTKENIAFLTSELKLEQNFTPNYLFNFFAKLRDMDHKKRRQRKDYLFNKFDIENFKEVKISSLSSGMKQKVSIAISLMHDPDYIIFDEPTNGLDVMTAKIVTDYLLEMKNQGKGILVSTHIMSLAERIADRVGIIMDGELKASGTIKELIKKNKVNNLEELFFNFAK
ncbi:MAG: ABC transporter ATP-binding protein [Candidatus Woesearchaeota archaeon]